MGREKEAPKAASRFLQGSGIVVPLLRQVAQEEEWIMGGDEETESVGSVQEYRFLIVFDEKFYFFKSY